MQSFFSYLALEVKRGLFSLRFMVCVIVTLFLLLLSPGYYVEQYREFVDMVMIVNSAVFNAASFVVVIALLPSLAYAGNYASDHTDGALKYFMVRLGCIKCIISKYIAAILSGMLVVGISFFLLIIIAAPFVPWYCGVQSATDGYSDFFLEGKTGIYLLLFTLHYMLSAAMFCATGFTVSLFVRNEFTAYAAPMVVYFMMARLTEKLPIPYRFRPSGLVQSIYGGWPPLQTFLGKLIPVLAYCLALGCVVVWRGKKNIRTD